MAQPLLTRLKASGAALEVLAPEWVVPVMRRMPEVAEVISTPFRHNALQLVPQQPRILQRDVGRPADTDGVIPHLSGIDGFH